MTAAGTLRCALPKPCAARYVTVKFVHLSAHGHGVYHMSSVLFFGQPGTHPLRDVVGTSEFAIRAKNLIEDLKAHAYR